MKTAAALAAEMRDTRVTPGELVFWWLGQHSFVVKTEDRLLALDPFLSPLKSRLVPPLLAASDLSRADLICGTHDHIDHIDRKIWPLIAAAAPQASFVVPELIRKSVAEDAGIPPARLIGLDDGCSAVVAGIRITGIAAAHEFLDRDATTGHYPYLGYVVETNGCTLYHAGDSCIYEGLVTKLRPWQFDVAFLPINGRDARRLAAGCIGNMTFQEAADLAGAIRPRLTVPAHYDMFAGNTADVTAFADYMAIKYPALPTGVCRHGEAVRLPAQQR